MIMGTAEFYDAMAEHYHLIFDDWEASMGRQGAALDFVLREECGPGALKVLDCSCGIGTQAIAMARCGHRVTGSDVSGGAIERARREAGQRGLKMDFFVSDMTSLNEVPERGFDVVATLDNALPHLSPEELCAAAKAMRGKLRDGGILMATIRDYDELAVRKPPIQTPSFHGREGERRIVHQVWDWIDSEKYVVHLYITVEKQGRWEVHHFAGVYRALKRAELVKALEDAGFGQVRWRMPEESGGRTRGPGLYLPLVTARAE
ncbi:MAG: class I SAM-dependent methyltransferase [Terracidiphilus sp.]